MAASNLLQNFAIVMIDMGIRPEDVIRIEVKNLNLSYGYIFIPFGKTKTAKRKIPLNSRVSDLLSKRLNEMGGRYLFANESPQGPLTTIKTAHAGALRRAKLPHFRLYDLRHTYSTRFIESGGDIATLRPCLSTRTVKW